MTGHEAMHPESNDSPQGATGQERGPLERTTPAAPRLDDRAAGGSGAIAGIVTALAVLPEKVFLDESAMACVFGVTQRTIRRMVQRFELPPPIPFAGRSICIAGRVLAYLNAAAERVEQEAERTAARLERASP